MNWAELVERDLGRYTAEEIMSRLGSPNLIVQPEDERFWQYVDKNGPIHPILRTPCWLWIGRLCGGGYGQFARSRRSGNVMAHRYSFQQAYGPIPDGLEIDHMCRVRQCVNPHHLDIVTRSENIKRAHHANRKSTCRQGHELTLGPWGKRYCPTCNKLRQRKYRAEAHDVSI